MIQVKKKLITAPIFLVICSIVLCAFVGKANGADGTAGPSIVVAPHTFDLSLEQGEKYQNKFKIYNRGNFAIPFKIQVVSFDAVDETGEMELDESVDPATLAVDWFEFQDDQFIIDPQEKKDIEFTIKVPNGIEDQGYYVVAMLEADISTYLFNESKLQVIPNIGVVFMLKVGQVDQETDDLDILEYSVIDQQRLSGAEKITNFLSKPFLSSEEEIDVTKVSQPTFLIKLKNNSLYHKKLTGKIELSGVGRKLESELEFPPMTILPGKTRKVLVKGIAANKDMTEENPKESPRVLGEQTKNEGDFGLLQADLNVHAADGLDSQQSRLVLVYSWKIIALLALLVIGLMIVARMTIKKILMHKSNKK